MMHVGPVKVSKWKHQSVFSQQRRGVGQWAGEEKDWVQEVTMERPS